MNKKKIRIFLVVVVLLISKLNGLGQEKVLNLKVTLNLNDQSISSVLNEIRQQTGINFAYDKASIPLDKKVSISKQNCSIEEVLNTLFKDEDVNYKAIGNQISFYKTKIARGKNYTICGYVKDEESGEALIGATIYLPDHKKGTISNVYGFFSITLPANTYNIKISFIGYRPYLKVITLSQNIQLDIKLRSSIEIEEVVVTASEGVNMHSNTQMGLHFIQMKKIEKLPVLLGEKDLIKTIQLFPGVQSGSEGGSGLYVRGGSPDQNLLLLDGVPIYNANHLFGFFSVFNTDAINNAQLIKSGFPARYGGRLSSVLDIRMKEGNMNKLKGTGSIGVISAKFSLEGPILKDKTSFIVSGRRTYIDLLTKPIIAITNKNSDEKISGGYYFYDLNIKINHKFSNKSRLYFSSYLGDDRFNMKSQSVYSYNNVGVDEKIETSFDARLSWGNQISVMRWNWQINPKLFSNTTFTYSKYKFITKEDFSEKITETGTITESFSQNLFTSSIYDLTGKFDFDYIPSPNHYIKFGAGNIYHTFQPGGNQSKYSTYDSIITVNQIPDNLYAHEYSAYLEDDFKLGSLLKFNAGLHFSGFKYSKKTFNYIQPRLSMRFLLSENSSIKASYARMTQYLHLLTNPTIGLPTDLWVPATIKAPAEYADQFALGYSGRLKKGLNFNIEAFYKKMNNLIEYKEGSSFLGNNKNWEDKIELGNGESYGAEFFIEKNIGETTGWIGYTLSWSNRTFENIDFGKTFPYRYDRRHDISLVITHKLSDKIDFGVVWVYGTGQAVTLGFEEYKPKEYDQFPENNKIVNNDKRNNYRTPAYHRLDININFNKETKWGQRTWSFGLYNAYSRLNPFYINIAYRNNGEAYLKQTSLFPIIPSVLYSFKF